MREALEETGLRIELERYLVDMRRAVPPRADVPGGRTSSSRAHDGRGVEPLDTEEIAEARWGTLEELAGPLRERLLATGRAFWRYRVALHDAALAAL